MFGSVKKLRMIRNYIRNEYAIRKFNSEHSEIKEILAPNKVFQNKFKGKRCFVLGNGPSLGNVDFERLQDEIVFTVNQLPRNSKFEKLKTNFHVWADERFFNIDDSKAEDRELLEVMKSVNTAGNKPVVFYNYSAKQMIEKYQLDKMLDIHYIALVHLDFEAYTKRHKIKIDKCFPVFPTVVHNIIAMAVDMGFSEIILLGCDCTGFLNVPLARLNKAQEADYNYTITNNEKKRMEKLAKQTSIRDELYSYVLLFDRYKLLYDYCCNYGVKLLNATESTLLDNIPPVNLNSVLNR